MDVVDAAGIPIETKFSILEAWEADERGCSARKTKGWAVASMRICSGYLRRSASSRTWELAHSGEGG
jgi:hypothetical protein